MTALWHIIKSFIFIQNVTGTNTYKTMKYSAEKRKDVFRNKKFRKEFWKQRK